jgi:hypothetical protein
LSDGRQGNPSCAYPRFIDVERDCPPEGCGGISGFYDMLEIRSDLTHEQYAEINTPLEGDARKNSTFYHDNRLPVASL